MYICFDALKRNWLAGCRPMLGLNGCFLKGFCKGQLLAAIGRDGNNNIFPVAWAVVESESKESWRWFLELLMHDLNYTQGHGLTIISDQQKGLMPAIAELLPLCEQRNCARHVYANLRKLSGGAQLKTVFWEASKASTKAQYDEAMKRMNDDNPAGHDYCVAQNPNAWARSHFQTFSCCDNVDNNMSETFNGVIIESRAKPIITMLEEIRHYCMVRLRTKREEVEKWKSDIAPRMMKKLDNNIRYSHYWDCFYNGEHEYEVRRNDDGYVVNLVSKTCACRMWALSGIPCAHACSAIYHKGHKPEAYVAHWFTKDGTLKSYQYFMKGLNGMPLWPKGHGDPILPPIERRMPGRPKKCRRKDMHEEKNKNGKISRGGGKNHCSKCQGSGHNRRSCKYQLGEVTVKTNP